MLCLEGVSDLEYDPTDSGASLPGFWSAVALLRQTSLQYRISDNSRRRTVHYDIIMILKFRKHSSEQVEISQTSTT